MADSKNDRAAASAAAEPAPAQQGITVEMLQALKALMGSDADAARAQQLDGIRRQHLADDAARERGGTVRVVALTSFTVVGVDDTGATRTQVIRAGAELDFPRYDLAGYEGKVRLKALDADEDNGPSGVTISNA